MLDYTESHHNGSDWDKTRFRLAELEALILRSDKGKSHSSFVRLNKGSVWRAATMATIILSLHSTCQAHRLERLGLNHLGVFRYETVGTHLMKNQTAPTNMLSRSSCAEAELAPEITISILLSVPTNRIVPSQARQLLYERLQINCALPRWQWLSKFINCIVAIVTVWDNVWHGLLDFNEHLSLFSMINTIAVFIMVVVVRRNNCFLVFKRSKEMMPKTLRNLPTH